jgi:7-cyano-7-deazaguanine synthase
MTTHSKALVILSGGQDSTTCLFWAKKYYAEVHAITFDYGQRHRLEIAAAIRVAEMAGVRTHEVVEVPECLKGTSPLTDLTRDLEKYENADQMEQVIGERRELTFVPMRNALFLTIAANRAEVLGGCDLITGVCQMDNANYDDCRQIFIDAAEYYINTALGHDHRGTPTIKIVTPLMNLSKAETVALAYELPDCWAAMAFTHTSYDGRYPPTDPNHANVLRADGFEKAGLPDPLVVRAYSEGLMPLPGTANYSPEALARAGFGAVL